MQVNFVIPHNTQGDKMIKTIKRFDIFSVVKFMGLFYTFIGFLVGAGVAILSTLSNAFVSSIYGKEIDSVGIFISSIFLIILSPIFYGIIGVISGALFAFLYNLFSSIIGGIKIEIDD